MKKAKNVSTLLILSMIVVSAFLGRWTGYNAPHKFTFDEGLYVRMGLQLKENPLNYTSQSVYNRYQKQGGRLPDYLRMPLFKHPPLYSYLISLFYFIFGAAYKTAFMVSLAGGLATIIITFLVAAYIFNKDTGLLAALLVSIDPVNWLCSEKIWIDTTLTALIWLTLLFLIKAILSNKSKFFFLAGITTGLALLTKYSALIIFPIGLSWALLYNYKLIKTKRFWSWILISLLLFLPWIIWNFIIYGADFFPIMITGQGDLKLNFYNLFTFWILISSSAAAFLTYHFLRNKTFKERLLNKISPAKAGRIGAVIFLVLLFSNPYMLKGLCGMLNAIYVPSSGWAFAFFSKETRLFYFKRLIELSPFYIISFLSLPFIPALRSKQSSLFIAAFWIMLIFSLHRNFQSRYILPATPALLIIASGAILKIIEKIKSYSSPSQLKISIVRVSLTVFLIYCFLKTIFINLCLSLPNRSCYF
ncbi:MAG: glycosyltransferase family 39 protein [Candidatus Omnitrophica bacterium]|nr:glycosyltransferase family 39 protein [Candidatus Omnitrophota bacterium]